MSEKISYRKDIDGLRALAVLFVVAAHLGVSFLEGGFIGVDVFFVISGYLITALFLAEHKKFNSISFSNFYLRRAKRLLPALITTVSFTIIVGFLVLSNERFTDLVNSSVASLFSVSNFYFWSLVGYFDSEASSKPLLHTWSLGVEEQFYLFWPLLIGALLKIRSHLVKVSIVIILGVLSFGLNALFISYEIGGIFSRQQGFLSQLAEGSATAFYLFPFRIFEFAIGALIAFAPNIFCQGRSFKADLVVAAGLAIVFFCALFLREDSVFPYYNALAVAFGAALLIYAGASSNIAHVVFSNSYARFIGKISYSVYLVHWPVIVFWMLLLGEDLSQLDQLVLVAIIFTLAVVLHFTIEKPLRSISINKYTGIRYWFGRLALPSAIIIVASIALAFKNYEGRIPDPRKTMTNKEWISLQRGTYCGENIPGFPESLFNCQNFRGSDTTIVLWGDSHASHLVAGVSEIFPANNIAVAYRSGCTPQSGFSEIVRKFSTKKLTEKCIDHNRQFVEWAENTSESLVIIISSAKRDDPKRVAKVYNDLARRLSGPGHSVHVIGDFIRPGTQIAQCRAVPDYILSDSFLQRICRPDEKKITRELAYNEVLKEYVSAFVPINDIQCPESNCNFIDKEGRVLYRDHHHLSVHGSIVMMQRVYPRLAANIDIDVSESEHVDLKSR